MDSGTEKSFCSSCHHDIIYEKINFRVPHPHSSPQYAFESKTINEKVQVLSEVLKNILNKFSSSQIIKV